MQKGIFSVSTKGKVEMRLCKGCWNSLFGRGVVYAKDAVVKPALPGLGRRGVSRRYNLREMADVIGARLMSYGRLGISKMQAGRHAPRALHCPRFST